jgi:hypothetical protein
MSIRWRAPLLLGLTLTTVGLSAQADWKQDMKDKARAQAAQTAQEKLGLPLASPAGAKVYFIEPKNGATIKGPVKVVFGLSGMGVAPAGTNVEDTGHHHLLINDPKVDLTTTLPATEQVLHFGKGQTETTLTLKPGQHTLQLVLGDYKHQPHNPAVVSEKITITVQ